MLEQIWLFFDGKLSLQCPQDTLKCSCILFFGRIISGEMDILAATGQLSIHLSEWSHFIGANQNVADPRFILEMFEVIELALELAATGCFGQMMGFIDNDRQWFALK